MIERAHWILVLAVVTACSTVSGQTPTLWCLPHTGDPSLLTWAELLATEQGTAYDEARGQVGLSLTTLANVEYVTDESTCQAAATANSQQYGGYAPRPVHVVRILDRYLVRDPDLTTGEFSFTSYYTDSWDFIRTAAG